MRGFASEKARQQWHPDRPEQMPSVKYRHSVAMRNDSHGKGSRNPDPRG